MNEKQDPAGSSAVPNEQREFVIKDCALISIATGRRAYTLVEFRDMLAQVDVDSIYHHFWGGLLEPRFEEREYNNDFAAWARRGLHDTILAERLAMLDPTRFEDMQALRQALLDVVDDRLDESEYLSWMRAGQRFEFIRSQIVVFDTRRRLHQPEELADAIPRLSTSSVFYHFIDARRRQPDRRDDFQIWLAGFDSQYHGLCEQLSGVDPYFSTLGELRGQLARLTRELVPGAAS